MKLCTTAQARFVPRRLPLYSFGSFRTAIHCRASRRTQTVTRPFRVRPIRRAWRGVSNVYGAPAKRRDPPSPVGLGLPRPVDSVVAQWTGGGHQGDIACSTGPDRLPNDRPTVTRTQPADRLRLMCTTIQTSNHSLGQDLGVKTPGDITFTARGDRTRLPRSAGDRRWRARAADRVSPSLADDLSWQSGR